MDGIDTYFVRKARQAHQSRQKQPDEPEEIVEELIPKDKKTAA